MLKRTAAFCLAILGAVLITIPGCRAAPDFDRSLSEITRPYAFSIAGWEIGALPQEAGDWFVDDAGGVEVVFRYFSSFSMEERAGLAPSVEKVMAGQIEDTLAAHGIYNPMLPVNVSFPPVNFSLEPPPHLLVISPRESIESVREVRLVQEMNEETMETIETEVDGLGVSSLVVDLGGFGGTYPTFVADGGGLRYTIETAVEEWLHQYLTFTPLGFRYLLDVTGISTDYEIATMNETVAGIVSSELADEIYRTYYAGVENGSGEADHAAYYKAMRETRLAVDGLLAAGRIDEAESYMEERRQYILSLGYYIRKLNQAYFAFHGTYADSPSSVDPIGEELEELRARSASVKVFLDTVTPMTGRGDLQQALAE